LAQRLRWVPHAPVTAGWAQTFYYVSGEIMVTAATKIYLAVSFGFAWVLWGLAWLISNNYVGFLPLVPVLIIGSFGPFVAAGLCTFLRGGSREMLRFYARAFRVRMGWLVFALAFFLMPVLATMAAAVHAWSSGTPFAFTMTPAHFPVAYIWLFFLGGAVAEEFGWSYLSDRLDEALPAVEATLVLGTVWAFWHLPLWLLIVPGLSQHFTPFPAFWAFCVGSRFLYSWAYHRGGNSILSNLLFHNAANVGYSIVVIAPRTEGAPHDTMWILTALTGLCALGLWYFSPVRVADRRAEAPAPV